ncbi:MAG: hypothetical protein ACK4TL_12850 [Hyphomicrobiaceae bacterium]
MYSVRLSWGALFEHELKLPAIRGEAFVFGAAPDPVIPERLLHKATIATANASQIPLEAYGIHKPHITFMRTNMSKGRDVDLMKLEALRDRQTGLLVLMAEQDAACKDQLALLKAVNYRFDDMLIATAVQRSMLQNTVLGTRAAFLLKRYRPSMGFQAVMFCLGMGAGSVALSGVSFRSDGCSFSPLSYKRKHVDGDRAVLARIRRQGLPVYAVEEAFAADTGLPRWSTMAAAA